VITDNKLSIRQAQTRCKQREAVALSKNKLERSEEVLELIRRAEYGDLRGAAVFQLGYLGKFVRYFYKKNGLSKKQIKHLRITLQKIEENQYRIITNEGSLEALFGERKSNKKNHF